MVNPKSGKGKGQKILEQNPKSFTFANNFWKDLQGCGDIKQIDVGFYSTEREEKLQRFYSQMSTLSTLSSSKEVDQYVVVCGGDGSLSHIISELQEHRPDFAKIAFTMVPLGTFNDLSRSLNSFKLAKYAKSKRFDQKRLPETVAKILHKILQSEVVLQDVWKVGVDCLKTGGIKQIMKDGTRVREEYILEYDQLAIQKAEV